MSKLRSADKMADFGAPAARSRCRMSVSSTTCSANGQRHPLDGQAADRSAIMKCQYIEAVSFGGTVVVVEKEDAERALAAEESDIHSTARLAAGNYHGDHVGLYSIHNVGTSQPGIKAIAGNPQRIDVNPFPVDQQCTG
jgi:hypothetical protein